MAIDASANVGVRSHSLMAFEKPPLRVSRTVAACARCRAAKIKCSNEVPACAACEKAGKGAECASSNGQFARGRERSYVTTLETRVEKLQKRLAASQPQEKPGEDVPSLPPIGERVTSPTSMNGNGRPSRESTNINDLVSDFGYLAVNASSRDFYGFTSSVSYARLVLAAASRDALPSGLIQSLPSKRDAMSLVEHYMSNIFVVLPIFDETSFWSSLETIYAAPARASPTDVWNLRMVLAISLMSHSVQRGDAKYTEAVANLVSALELADQVLHPGSLASISAMLLLVEYSRLDPHHFDVWTLIGATSRVMVDLGIHQDPQRIVSMSKAKLEARRRIYHCVYALDRAVSMAQRRAFSFSDDSASVAFPRVSGSNSASANQSSNHSWLKSYDCALDVFRLRQLQSRFYQDIFQTARTPWQVPYSYIWQCWHNLSEWYNALSLAVPPAFKSLLELELLYSYIYLLSPSPKVAVICDLAQSLMFEYCLECLDKVHAALGNTTTRPWFNIIDAMRLYMISQQFLDLLSKHQSRILSGIPPDPVALPPATAAAPPFPSQARSDNTERALLFIKQMQQVLGTLGSRFGFMSWRDRFEKESEAIAQDLMSKQRERSRSSSSQPPPIIFHNTTYPTTGPQYG